MPDDFSSDLLDKNDLIFAALNFFRYVIISDPKEKNATRFWDILVVITENFLNPLHKAVELSRAHYKLELVKLKEIIVSKKMCKGQQQRKTKDKSVVSLKVLNDNGPMPEMTMEQEHNVIILALQNFDVLESVISRIKELIDLQVLPQPQQQS